MSVESNHRRFLYQRLYDYVLDEIRAGRLSRGDRVPSEMELAQRFGVSRITSKKALQTLNRDGVVERIVGKGSFVAAQLPALERLPSSEAAPRSRRRAGRSCIGFVLPAFSPAFEIGLLEGVEARTAELGLNLIVRRTHGRQDVEEQVIDSLIRSELVDGLIVFAVNGDYYNRSLLRLVLEQAPLVLADRALNGIAACAVTTDNHAAALELTGMLLAMGHEHLAFVSAPVSNTASLEDRLAGFRGAHRARPESTQHFLTTLRSSPNMPSVSGDTDADRAAIGQLLDEHPEITAFVAAEYQFAVLVQEVLASLGRLDGRTIACFDMPDLPFAPHDFLHVRQDERAMGRLAVDLVLDQVKGGEVPPVSTVPYAIVDPATAR